MKQVITIVFFLGSNFSFAQKDSGFKLIKTIPGNYKTFAVDNLENIFVFNKTGQLKKINNNGDSVGVFNDIKRYGLPSNIDVSNPLKILLYYNKFSTIVTLDRFLALRNTINLRKKGLYTVNTVATSYDNNFWIFDEQDFKLKKADEEIKTLIESNDLRQLLDTVPSPQKIINRENAVYLYDSLKGFYIFDNYGAYKNHLPFIGWKNVEANETIIYGFKVNKLYSYQLQSLRLNEFTLPTSFLQAISIKAVNGKIYVLYNDGLKIYQL